MVNSEFVHGLDDQELLNFIIIGRNIWDEGNTTGVAMPPRGGNPGLTDGGKLTRRAYALGNFSRFVRPGFERVNATNSPLRGVFVSAYQAPDSARFAVIAINSNAAKRGDVDEVIVTGGY